jgi:hypothetical protein
MKLIYSSIFLCWSVLLYAQPLSNGMGIITHWSGGAGQFNSFSVFDTQNNASAPLGINWETNFYTPNPAIEERWKGTFIRKHIPINSSFIPHIRSSAQLEKTKTLKCIQERGIDISVKNKITPWIINPLPSKLEEVYGRFLLTNKWSVKKENCAATLNNRGT